MAERCLKLCGGGVGLAEVEGPPLVFGENGARDGEGASSLDLYFVSGHKHHGATRWQGDDGLLEFHCEGDTKQNLCENTEDWPTPCCYGMS